MFKNLCFDGQSKKWQYHRREDLAEPPTWTHRGERREDLLTVDPHVTTEFRQPVATSSGFNEGFRVSVVDGSIPSNVTWISGLTIWRAELGPWANAIGHMYAEYIYAIWHSMDVVGVVSRDARVLMEDTPCNIRGKGANGKPGVKCPHFQTLMRGLSDRYRDSDSVLRPNFPHRGRGTACYRSLVVGDGTLHGSSRRHTPESWGKFIHFWLAGLGIDPRARPDHLCQQGRHLRRRSSQCRRQSNRVQRQGRDADAPGHF